jgi:lysophospholipase L1-like esterase
MSWDVAHPITFQERFARTPKLRIAILGLFLGATVSLVACDSSPTSPSGAPQPGSNVEYAAVGASDVAGIGASAPCPFGDCPQGTGYVSVAVRQLRSRGYTVTLWNLGLPGAALSPRLQSMGQQYGRVIVGNLLENAAPIVPRVATLVTIFTGANDVNIIAAALAAGVGGGNPNAYVDQQVQAFGDEFRQLLEVIRDRSATARIVVLNLPNIGAIPMFSGDPLDRRLAAQRASVRITTTVLNPLASQGIRVIDLMCDARFYQPSSFSADGFHPNDAGYALMADEVVRATTSASYPAPQGSCAQMTLVG